MDEQREPDVRAQDSSVDYLRLYQHLALLLQEIPAADVALPPSGMWLLSAANHTSTALLDILAGLVEVTREPNQPPAGETARRRVC